MSLFHLFEQIEEASGTNAKKELLEREASNPLLRRVLRLALDPYIKFNVGKWKLQKTYSTTLVRDTTLESFCATLEKLDKEQIRGGDGFDLLAQCFDYMSATEAKWCQRFLLKKPRLGINESSINEVLPGCIRTFTVALCKTLDAKLEQVEDVALIRALQANYANKRVIKMSEAVFYLVSGDEVVRVTFLKPNKVKFPVGIQEKRDGWRLFGIKRNGEVTFFTRNGNEVDTVPHLVAALEAAPVDNVIVDGEVMGNVFDDTSSVLASTKNAKDTAETDFHIFSVFPLSEWDAQDFKTTYRQQYLNVQELVAAAGNKHLKAMTLRVVNNFEELLEAYLDYLDLDFEGVILKPLDGVYTLDKTDEGWWKFKPEQTYEGSVVGWFKGTTGSKRENCWAGFWIMLENGVATRVGTGFNDPEKAAFDLMVQSGTIEQVYGDILECKAQPPLTKDGKMRFPRAQREGSKGPLKWRNRKDVDPAVPAAYDRWASDSNRKVYPIERRRGDK